MVHTRGQLRAVLLPPRASAADARPLRPAAILPLSTSHAPPSPNSLSLLPHAAPAVAAAVRHVGERRHG
eukprot:5049218-Prymnesium_polylepis.1